MAKSFDMTHAGRISRRQILRGGAIGAGALAGAFLLACSDDDNGDSAQSSPEAGAAKQGGVLRMGLTSDLTTTEPARISLTANEVIWPVWDSLTTLDHQLKPIAGLAEKWEQSGDNLQLTLHLRPDVTFHSGRPFTSEDVKFNITRVQDPAAPFAQYRAMASKFTSVETPNAETVIIKTAQPLATMFDFFELFKMTDMETIADPVKMVGTGAFKLAEFKQGSIFRMEKNPNYWGTKANLDGITWSLALNPEAMVAQLEANALDGIFNPPVTGFVRFKDDSNYQTMIHPASGGYYINGFNMTKPPFNDKRVRQAFQWATDRQRFTSLLLKGIAEPSNLPWPENSVAYEDSKNKIYSLDLKKAGDLLRAAGVTSLTTECITTPARQETIDFLSIWQNDLKGLGVTLEPQVLQSAAFVDQNDNLKYDAVYAAGAGGAGLSAPVSMFVTSTNIWSGDGKNNVGFNHPRWQELTNLLIIETDAQKQKRLYSEVNDIFLDEVNQAIMAPVEARLAMNKKVKGVTHQMHDGFDYAGAWLET
jgi:peptide/nickel transport system substrate-binding protein